MSALDDGREDAREDGDEDHEEAAVKKSEENHTGVKRRVLARY